MGRPLQKKREDKSEPIKAKRSTPSGSHLGKSNFYKGDFQRSFGNAKTGRGYTLTQKSRLLSRFKRKLKRKNKHDETVTSEKSLHINHTPLAEDELRNDSATDTENENLNKSNASTFSFFKKKKNTTEKSLKRVEIDYVAIQEERKQKAAEFLRIKGEEGLVKINPLCKKELQASMELHEKTVTKNIRKRKVVTKRLSQRTKRGQPIMANSLELILDKLKKN